LPIRQHIEGAERKIVIAEGGLAFDCDGEIVESSPAREEAVRRISAHIVAHGGAALLIDYGHERSEAGDTLQAVRGHRFAPVLERPGEQDLTAHVDFEAVRRVATETGGLATRVVGQGEWLRALGIDARAKALSSANPGRAADIEGARDRLISPDQMGELFKAMAIHAPSWPIPAGLA
jgi:SAM-dependent MidA family methyltransferase